MVLLAWPLVVWVGWFFGLSDLLALFCLFFLSLRFLFVYPCILLGALLSFIQYIAFTDKKKN